MATALFVVPKSMPQIEASVGRAAASTTRRGRSLDAWIRRAPRAKDDDADAAADAVGAVSGIARMVRRGVQLKLIDCAN